MVRATAKNRGSRFPDALELAAAFRAALEGGPVVRDRVGDIRNPYKGLRAFLEADAADFFGREKVTERIVRRLAQAEPGDRFLALVGPSGSGKSSVVRAGVVPALRRGALPGSGRWYVVDIHPGSQPLRELESALLAVAVEPPPSLLEELEADELGLVRAAATVLPDRDAELVLVLDQFEELFTLVPDEDERSHVLASLRAAASDPQSRVRVIATLRADFYDQPLSVPGFGDLLAARNEAITPMSPEELERAIAAPADRAGLVVEPILLAAMIADVADRPGALPLLQYALTELAERAEEGVLTLKAYNDIGRVSGALARRAEQLYEGMNEIGRIACRQLFLRLVSLGEGSEDTRRRVRRSEVLPLTDAQAMDGVIESFGRHRLLSFDRDPSSREPTVEIAHEALIGAWARLHGWIAEARDDIRTQRQLSAAAADWDAGARDPSFLLRGARLEQVAAWAETSTLAMSDQDREFVETSVHQRESELAEQRATAERERALERRSVRRLRGLVAVVVAALLVASTLTVVAVSQRNRAQREGRVATSRELAAAAVANLDVDAQRSLLLALAAADASGEDTMLPEVEEALRRAVVEDREVLTISGLPSGLFGISPDGNYILTRSRVEAGDGEPADLVVHDATTGASVHRLEGVPGGFVDARWSPDGSRVIASTVDSTLVAWDTESWSREWRVNLGREITDAGGIEFSPDGRLLGVAGIDGIVSIVNADTGDEERRLSLPGHPPFLNVAFSPDATRVGAAPNFGGVAVPIWDVETGHRVLELPVEDAFGIAFSPDGSAITTSGSGGAIQVWDARTGQALTSLDGHQGEVWGVAYSPDGRLLASVADDGVRVWNVGESQELLNLRGHEGTVFGVRFEPDGRHLVTSGVDGTVRVWDVSAAGSHELLTIGDWWGGFEDADFSPDGTRLATIGWGGFRQWEAHTGSPVSAAGPDGSGGFSFGPEGTHYVTEGRPSLGEARPGGAIRMMDNKEDISFWSAAYSPDGTTVAGGVGGDEKGLSGLVYVWDVETGARVLELGEVGTDYDHIRGLAYSPDGRLLAGLAASGGVHLWDLASGQEVRGWQTGTSNGEGIAFSPDGTLLVTSGADGAVVWKTASGKPVVRLRGHASDVPEVAFSPDGTMVATAGEDGTARVWDVSTGNQLHVFFGHRTGLNSVAFSPDGRSVATSSDDGTVREYYLHIDDLIREASSRLTRTLSAEECRTFLHVSPCPSWVRRPVPIEAAPAADPGLEGSFRVTMDAADLHGSLTDQQAKRTIGHYTLSMFDGSWWLHQEQPNGLRFDFSGSYTTDGETLTFTDLSDPECFGASWSERWALNGTSLLMSDTSPAPSPTCTGQQISKWTGIGTWDQKGEAWAQTIFEAPGWARIA
jgi:WD40 repeat protein